MSRTSNTAALEAARKALVERGRVVKSKPNLLDNSRVQERVVKLRRTAPSVVNAYEKAMSGRSRSLAMKFFCLECVGFVRQEVRLCTSPTCSLYPYRPYQGGDDEEMEDENADGGEGTDPAGDPARQGE